MTSLPPGLRAVVAARVSHVQGTEKTSHITQADTGTRYASQNGCDIVGTVEDLNVSAIKKSPWERKDLKRWLDRPNDFDVLIFSKTDRVFRKADDTFELSKWAKEHRKILVIVDDSITLDFYTPEEKQDPMTVMMSRMFLFMASFFAEMEGRRFLERAEGRIATLKNTTRWGYGIAPFGFVIVDHPEGKGKALDYDDWAQEVLHHAAAKFLAGGSWTGIVNSFNDEGVFSARDWNRAREGKEIRGDKWTVEKLQKMLSNPTTQGIKTFKNRIVLDESGEPVRVGPSTFDAKTWEWLQTEISRRAQEPTQRRHSDNPMLGVCKCGVCGKNMRQRSQTTPGGVTHRYYVCGNSPKPCPMVSIIADQAEEIVETAFLETHLNRIVRKRVWRIGSDHTADLEQTIRTIASLREDREAGLYTSDDDVALFRSQMKSLTAKRDELAALPIVKPGWVNIETGKTYGEVWESASSEEKRTMLVDANVRLVVTRPNEWTIHTSTDTVLGEGEAPNELYDRLTRQE